MELILNIAALLGWSWLLWTCYRQGKLLKRGAQILEMNHGRIAFLESQLDQCYEAARRKTAITRERGDNNVALAHVNGLIVDYHNVRLQRDYLLTVLEEYKARYGKLDT